MIASTTTVAEAAERSWDAIVIGAGPAGSAAALQIAASGLRALLIDRVSFPRTKVCGACLNGNALAGIRALGLAGRLDQLGGVSLDSFLVRSGGRKLGLSLPIGMAVTRQRLDAMLVEAAIEAGADFVSGVNVSIDAPDESVDVRRVTALDRSSHEQLTARAVVMATGLAAERRVSDPALDVIERPESRIGAGTSTRSFPSDYVPGTIYMAVARGGYVGLTHVEGGSLNIAAALDRHAMRDGTPASVCKSILTEAGFPVSPGMLSSDWRGTISLTRHRRAPASYRLFVVGDASGYIEPFTGEGMAWALCGGRAVAPFVARAVGGWNDQLAAHWLQTTRKLVGRRQRWCRVLARVLRYPALVRGLLPVLGAAPSLGQAMIRRLNQEDDTHAVLDDWTRHGVAT